jgi:membrane associated rhomboid family serine protease
MTITLIIIAITAVISMLAFNNQNLIRQLILWPPALNRDHQYYRLITYGLIHADAQHLLFNMLTLFFFGRAMEQLYNNYLGAFGFAIFYVGGLVISILPTYLRNRNNAGYRSLGASGAVSGVLFAFILLRPWVTIYVFFFPVPAIIYAALYIAYSIYMDRRSADNINHSAHLWGGLYGIVFTILMEPKVIGLFLDSLTHPNFRMAQ